MLRIRFKKLPYVVALGIMMLFAWGCLDCEQKTSLNPDMSGTISIHLVSNPKAAGKAVGDFIGMFIEDEALRKSLSDSMEKAQPKLDINIDEEDLLAYINISGIKDKSFRKEVKDGKTHIYFSAAFDNILDLYKEREKISIAKDDQGLIVYKEQHVYVPSEKEKEVKKNATQMKSLFKDCYFNYTLVMPSEIASANTEQLDSNSASWNIPLEDFLGEEGFIFEVKMKADKNLLDWLYKYSEGGKQ
ncbi:MAG: hypothetical protein JW734_05765 [Candidatus Omnitrophica bacterium]|nr:hypothetical protein [Candidatus Omnitrophota bacterium]